MKWERWCARGDCGACGKPRDAHPTAKGCEEFVARPRVFSLSMGDWLDHEVPAEWLAEMLTAIRLTPHLSWLLLTKRPELWRQRLGAAYDWWDEEYEGQADENYSGHYARKWIKAWLDGKAPENVWVGVTGENQTWVDRRVPELLKIPARVYFLSCEPLLGPITLPDTWPGCFHGDYSIDHSECAPVRSWIIAGGESGRNPRPMDPEWARSLRDQCKEAGVPFFMKQMWGKTKEALHDIPADLLIREFPHG